MSKTFDEYFASNVSRRSTWLSKMPELAACWMIVVKRGTETHEYTYHLSTGSSVVSSSEDIREPAMVSNIDGPREISFEVNNFRNKYTGTGVFDLGNTIEFWLGWDSYPEFVGAGEIVLVKPRRDNNIGPIYFVVAKDRSHRLHETENTDYPRKDTARYYKENASDRLDSVPYSPRVFYSESTTKEVTITTTNKKQTDATYVNVDGRDLICYPQQDQTVEVTRSTRSRTYKGMRDDQIVGDIVRHFGFDYVFDITTGKKGLRILKKGVSPYAFIKRLALINDFYFWTEYDPDTSRWVAFFKKSENALAYRPGFLYTYGPYVKGNMLLDFDVDRNEEQQTTEVQVHSWDTKLKKGIKHRIKEEILRSHSKFYNMDDDKIDRSLDIIPVSGASVIFNAFGRRLEVITDKPFRSKDEAKQFCDRYVKAKSQDYMTASGSIIGNPAFDAMQINRFYGLEPEENGQWEVTRCRHYLGSTVGYKIDFSARKIVRPGYDGSSMFFYNFKETLDPKRLSVLFDPIDWADIRRR